MALKKKKFHRRALQIICLEIGLFLLAAMSWAYALTPIASFKEILDTLSNIPGIGSLFVLFQFWYLTLIPFLIANAFGLIGYLIARREVWYCIFASLAYLIMGVVLFVVIKGRAVSLQPFGPQSAMLLLMVTGIPMMAMMGLTIFWGVVFHARDKALRKHVPTRKALRKHVPTRKARLERA